MENQSRGHGGVEGFAWKAKLKEWYELIFVPYAVLSIPYIFLGTVAAFVAFYSGIDIEDLKFKWIPLGLSLGFIVLLLLEWLRWNTNRRARKNSENKKVKILYEENGLHFRDSGFVDYCSSLIICPMKDEIESMVLFLEWHGALKDVAVEYEDGCEVTLKKVKESSGLHVVANFKRRLSKGSRYPFSFILRFDNSNELIGKFLKKVMPYLPEKKLVQFLKFDSNAPTRFVEAVYPAGYVEVASKEIYRVSQGGYHEYPVERPRQGKSYKVAVAELN